MESTAEQTVRTPSSSSSSAVSPRRTIGTALDVTGSKTVRQECAFVGSSGEAPAEDALHVSSLTAGQPPAKTCVYLRQVRPMSVAVPFLTTYLDSQRTLP